MCMLNDIKNIISPALKTDLIDDFRNKKYASIIDESTDILTQKHLCILVQFLSDRTTEIVTGFIDLNSCARGYRRKYIQMYLSFADIVHSSIYHKILDFCC